MTTQYPIDGRPGKAWHVSAPVGWRINPVTHKRSHHNGADIVADKPDAPVEAFHNGSVISVGYNPAGFGNYVILRHNIDGKFYTSLYAHMKAKPKVKVGDRVDGGTQLGVMGTTGMSTGVHLHWEIQAGRFHVYNALGVGFVEPISFTEKLIHKEKK